MNTSQFNNAKKEIIQRLLNEKEKEYYCHIQFVVKLGLKLSRTHNVDSRVIELSCLLHDIGRDHEEGEEDHADAGARISTKILENLPISKNEKSIIVACVKNHNKILPEYSLEEKIVITADAASKVVYHEAFMLLCKKQTYTEKLAWGQKYLEKGYKKILFPEYKDRITKRYETINKVYQEVSNFL